MELFDKGQPETLAPVESSHAVGSPRLRIPQRDQVEMRFEALDELLEADHPARIVWATVERLDLSRWLGKIKAVEGHVGRDATDPRLLVALWVYATLEAVAHARKLARLCRRDAAFKWLCGGVTVNYHLLSSFRSTHLAAWDQLLTQIVASLLAEGLVNMKRVAQDGMRVRAHAGKASFHTKPTLERYLAEAREQVAALRRLSEENPDELTSRERAARERTAQERLARVEAAVRHCDQLQEQREERTKKAKGKPREARASTTDPAARTMQFSDGGYRPGVNVQFTTATDSGVILGVDVVNEGTDSNQLPPMLDQLKDRYGQVPEEALVDGGFSSLETIERAAKLDCVVYAPLKEAAKQLKAGKDPYARKPGDSDAVASWRARMGTVLGKAIYQLRGQTAELPNAQARNRGLYQMPVRGLPRCKIIGLLHAITHNIQVAFRLRQAVKGA